MEFKKNFGENLRYKRILIIIGLLVFTAVMSSCNLPSPKQFPGDPTPDLELIVTQIMQEHEEKETPTPEPTATVEPTPTPKKLETLTVCLGKEPRTLFFYDESSQAMWSVLESIYDGPFDIGDGNAVPVIFEDVTVREEPVPVQRGDIIVDINGNAVELKPGTVFLPADPASGCSGSGCLTTWNAVTETADINQTVITFRMKDGLFWNDGVPLTADDSVFSMNINGMKGIRASKQLYNLTDSYTALDEHTVEWRGLPGYQPADPSDVFWIPLPKHVMKGMSAESILASEEINTAPLGWGAWQISSWNKGNEIIADRNPYYTGTEPFFDRIVYKFFGRAGDNNIEALRSGACDIIDPSVDLGNDLEQILEDVRDGKESVYIRPELTRQELVLNFDPTVSGSLDLLSSSELRAAITQCIDRKALIRQILYGQSEIPIDFYPAGYSKHDPLLSPLLYDPENASAALDQLGWTIPEDDPEGIRISSAVSGIPYGTKLAFTLVSSDSAAAQKAAEMIREDLARCGIGLETDLLPLEDLYAQGPEGVLFGRKFDTAMFAWSAAGDPCRVYMSGEIPDAENHWVGTNIGAYRNEDYDEACLLPGLTEKDVRGLFAEELPAIPLYFNNSIGISSNNICGIADRIGSRSILWNLESLSRSESSCAVSQWNDIYRQP